ncbi:MAG: RNA polymerase sigma factor SigM [Acidimicrobiia bacterium]|nr:MAG: RNA polymerase sigma factor SigM [Acidimicrobiia bacterium]
MKARDASTDAEIKQVLVTNRDLGFTMLVRSCQPGIYSGARRLTHRHEDAEEVAQDTFLRAYRALDGYSDARIRDLRIRAWLWTIALNLCRDRAGHSRNETARHTGGPNAASDETPIDAASWNRRLARLSVEQRNAVVLRHVADLPIAEIAEITGRPEGTVKADVSRGLDRLRDALEREELK